MTRVAVIDSHGQFIARGESDLIVRDAMYYRVKVDGKPTQLYNMAYVWGEEHAEEVEKTLKENSAKLQDAERMFSKVLYETRNKFHIPRSSARG